MTKAEFKIWAMALKTYFPREKNLLPTPEAAELWYQELMDLDAEVLTAALREYVNTNREGWSPSIGELKALAAEIKYGKLPDWGEGWKEVINAIRRYGYMNETKALESMSETTRKAAQMIGWQDLCFSENPEAIRAQFRQVYETCAKRAVEDRQIPLQLKQTIENLGLPPGEEESCQQQQTTGREVTGVSYVIPERLSSMRLR